MKRLISLVFSILFLSFAQPVFAEQTAFNQTAHIDVDEILKPNIVPFQGGCNTVLESEQIPMGGCSMIQNMRSTHPGKKKRLGQRKLHTTADGTNSITTLYEFSKAKRDEKHFFAQMSDNDILEATNQPPAVTTGVFGSEVFSGSASSIPASWGNIGDTLIFSNGVDQHQIYPGSVTYIDKFVVYDGAAAPPNVPTIGRDYTDEATDDLTTTAVILDSLNTYTAHECIFVMAPMPIKAVTLAVSKVNGNAATLTGYYWNGSWTQATSLSDGTEVLTLDVAPATDWSVGATITGATSGETCTVVAKLTSLTYQISNRSGVFTLDEILSDGTYTADQGAAHPTVTTLAAAGTVTWTLPTDSYPNYMYGLCGYWYQFRVSAQLDAEVEITAVTFNTDWQDIENVWDSFPVDVIETQVYDQSADIYKTYGAVSIEIDSSTTSDKFYIASSDPICGIYVDVGSKPNSTAGTTVNAVYYFNGTAFASVGTITDGTAGLSNSGWITFPRISAHKRQFNENQYYAYWYYFTVDQTLNDDVIISLSTMPYFDIADFGKGYSNAVWKDRVVYAFDRDQYLFVSAKNQPQVLNGIDFGILEAGDGRSNKVVAMAKFHNELIAWQEERGKEGGCITLFEGFSPVTFGRLLLSTKIGALNAKSIVVIDGVTTSIKSDEVTGARKGAIAYWISHYGCFNTDGLYVSGISDDIQNYFDPLKDECIRRGYEDQMWIGFDSAYNIIRYGLVSGISVQTSTATSTTANKLVDTEGAFTTRKTVLGHPISHTIAIGDTVYNTTDDTSALITAIDSATILSLDTDIMVSGEGYEIYSATCNLFPVFDLTTKTWGFDLFAQNLTCMTEATADSGNVDIIQVTGGTKDGYMYQSNYSNNDVSTAIDAFIDMKLNANGREIELRNLILTLKTGSHLVVTPTVDGSAGTVITETSVSDVRNKYSLNERGQDMKICFQNNTAGEEFHLFGVGFRIYSNETR